MKNLPSSKCLTFLVNLDVSLRNNAKIKFRPDRVQERAASFNKPGGRSSVLRSLQRSEVFLVIATGLIAAARAHWAFEAKATFFVVVAT